MTPKPMPDATVTAIVETFARQIAAAVQASVAERIQAALAGALVPLPNRGLASPPRQAVAPVTSVAARAAAGKKQSRRLYRMPWFENPANSSSGMTCVDFRDQKKATPKVARARRLQGQYLGSLKSLKGAARAKVKRIAKEKGVAAAVKVALSLKKL